MPFLQFIFQNLTELYNTSGGCECNSTVAEYLAFVPFGGCECDSTVAEYLAFVPSGGCECNSTVDTTIIFNPTPSGGCECDSTVLSAKTFNSVDISWDITDESVIAEQTVYWWRIEAEIDKKPYIQYLTAPSISDLCTRLKEVFLVYPLLTTKINVIYKYLKPFRSTGQVGIMVDPWSLFQKQVGWETVPACEELNLEAGQSAGIITIPGNNADTLIFPPHNYRLSRQPTSATIIPPAAPNVDGGAVISYTPFHVPIGGISMTGTSPASAPFWLKQTASTIHTFGPPLLITGKSKVTCSHWHWISPNGCIKIGGSSKVSK